MVIFGILISVMNWVPINNAIMLYFYLYLNLYFICVCMVFLFVWPEVFEGNGQRVSRAHNATTHSIEAARPCVVLSIKHNHIKYRYPHIIYHISLCGPVSIKHNSFNISTLNPQISTLNTSTSNFHIYVQENMTIKAGRVAPRLTESTWFLMENF